MVVLSLSLSLGVFHGGKKKSLIQENEEKKKGKFVFCFFFFLKALGSQGTVSHLRALTSLEIRVFLNPSLLQEHAAQVRHAAVSEQRAYLANEPSSPKGPCLSHCSDTRSKSHSLGSCNCVCSRAHFKRTFEIQIFRSSTLPVGCFFPTSWMFPCPSSYIGLTEAVSPPQLRRECCNLRVKGWDSNFCCTFSSSGLLCHAFSSSKKEVTFFPSENGLRRGKKSPPCKSQASCVAWGQFASSCYNER